MRLDKRNFDIEKTREIIRENLLEACDNMESFTGYLADEIYNGRAALWEVTENQSRLGWVVLSLATFNGKQYLYVHALQGHAMVNAGGMILLFQLALLEKCIGVMMETKKRGMRRLLGRFGFRFQDEAYNHWRYEQSGLTPYVKEFFDGSKLSDTVSNKDTVGVSN